MNSSKLVPLILFAYNRPYHLKQTLFALQNNIFAKNTQLIIYIDGPKSNTDKKNVDTVAELCNKYSGFTSLEIKIKNHNIGLAQSIIHGVSEQLQKYDKVIVLEDDIVTTPHFLSYMNDALHYYEQNPHVFSIGGYSYPKSIFSLPSTYIYDTYASYRCCSWGWGTWADRWNKVDWSMSYFQDFMQDTAAQKRFNRSGPDMTAMLRMQHEGKIDSWAIRFCYAHFSNNMYCIYPAKSLANNIGLDNSGTHCGSDDTRANPHLDPEWQPKHFCPGSEVHPEIAERFFKVFAPRERNMPWYKKTLPWRAARKLKYRLLFPPRKPRVLFLNTLQKEGGAARAAWRLFKGVQKQLPDTGYLSLFKTDSSCDGLLQTSWKAKLARSYTRLNRIPLLFYPNRQKQYYNPTLLVNPFRPSFKHYKPSLVHVHWVAETFLKPIDLVKFRTPVVWTLHDTWAFTGGCHYVGECKGYLNECEVCPLLGSKNSKNLSHWNWRCKKSAYDRLNLTIVTPSFWLSRLASQSSLLRNVRIERIPNGIDLSLYKPIDHSAAKAYFGFSSDIPVILFGSQYLHDPRKGTSLLKEALSKITMPIYLLTFGIGDFVNFNDNIVQHRHVGTLSEDFSLALLYSAADVFVCPSKEDNLPNTVAEALSCGTPCVAFEQGGLPEMIQHKVTGWLAKPYDTADLAAGINYIINHQGDMDMRIAARTFAERNYDLEKVTNKYIQLYKSLL